MRTHKSVYTYAPTLGVKTDFETLLQRFTQTSTVRYEKFTEIWREMKMSRYCAGRKTMRECREFVEECIRLAMQYWLPPSAFQVRAGALYLLYGLYYFQLVNPKVKIRVTHNQWELVTEFQDQAREQQHLDVDFVFQRMKIDGAFMFVAKNEEIYPHMKDTSGSVVPDTMKDDNNHIDEVFSSQVLNQLAVVHNQYNKMKVALEGPDSTEPNTSLDIIHRDMVHSIYKTLRAHKDKQAGQHIPAQRIEDDPDYVPGQEANFKSMSLKQSLKKKAFGQMKLGKPSAVSGSDPTLSDKAIDSDAPTPMSPPRKVVVFKRGRKKLSDVYTREDMDVTLPDSFGSSSILNMPAINIIRPVLATIKADKTTSNGKTKGKPSKKKVGKATETELSSDTDGTESSDGEDLSLADRIIKKKRKASSNGIERIVSDEEDDGGKGKRRKKKMIDDVEDDGIGTVKGKKKKTKSDNSDDVEDGVGTVKGKGRKKKKKFDNYISGIQNVLDNAGEGKKKKTNNKESVGSIEKSGDGFGKGKKKKPKKHVSSEEVNSILDSNREESINKEGAAKGKFKKTKPTNDVIVEQSLALQLPNNKGKRKRSEPGEAEMTVIENEDRITVNPNANTGKAKNLKRKQVSVNIGATEKENGISNEKKLKSVAAVTDSEQGIKGKRPKSTDADIYTEMVASPTMKSMMKGKKGAEDDKVKSVDNVPYTEMVYPPEMTSSGVSTDKNKAAQGKKSGDVTYTEIVHTPTMVSSGTGTAKNKAGKQKKSLIDNITYTEIRCTPNTGVNINETCDKGKGKDTKGMKSGGNITYTEIVCTPHMTSPGAGNIKGAKGKNINTPDNVTYTEEICTPKLESSESSTNKGRKMKSTDPATEIGSKAKKIKPAASEVTGNIGEAAGEDKTAQEKLMDKINKRKKEARKMKCKTSNN